MISKRQRYERKVFEEVRRVVEGEPRTRPMLTFHDLKSDVIGPMPIHLAQEFAHMNHLVHSAEDMSKKFDSYLDYVSYFTESSYIDDGNLFQTVWREWLYSMKKDGQICAVQLNNYSYQGRHEQFITGKNVYGRRGVTS